MSFRNKESTGIRRQGDLLFIKRESLPQDRPFTASKDGVILEGEVTGHKHEFSPATRNHGRLQMLVMPEQVDKGLSSEQVQMGEYKQNEYPSGLLEEKKTGKKSLRELAVLNEELLRNQGTMAFVSVASGQQVVIQHPDHKDVHLTQGFWEVRRQREFIGVNAAGRLVQD